MTPHFNINNNTIVYYWDVDNETHKKMMCTYLSPDRLRDINCAHFVDRANNIISHLKL